jgi:hypothetical protein
MLAPATGVYATLDAEPRGAHRRCPTHHVPLVPLNDRRDNLWCPMPRARRGHICWLWEAVDCWGNVVAVSNRVVITVYSAEMLEVMKLFAEGDED